MSARQGKGGDGRGTLVLTAGGTGGHVFPAQALAQELVRRGHRVALVTDVRGADYGERFPGVDQYRVRAGTFAGRGMLGKVRALGDIAAGTAAAYRLLGRIDARAVVGFGGYPSLPTMLAALARGLPTCLHEQNAVLGRVNRLVAGRVNRVALSFDGTTGLSPAASRNAVLTGNPVRAEIIEAAHEGYNAPIGDAVFRILVTGGSQGARITSEVVPSALAALPPALARRLQVTQQCRLADIDRVRDLYERAGIRADLASFFPDLPDRLAWSHLVIARAGASTVSEVAVAGRPAILVPLPSAMDDHQSANARALDSAGGGWLVPQDQFTPPELAKRIQRLACVPERLVQAAAAARLVGRPGAAAALADLVETLAGQGANGNGGSHAATGDAATGRQEAA